jgi:hypothetical protein
VRAFSYAVTEVLEVASQLFQRKSHRKETADAVCRKRTRGALAPKYLDRRSEILERALDVAECRRISPMQ